MSHVDDGTLNALLDGELDAAARRTVEAHLAECAACRERLAEAEAFLAEAGRLLGILVPPGAGDAGAVEAAPPADAPRRVSRTAQEPAVDPEAPPSVARTAKEPAVHVDGPTQKSPAVRPMFGAAHARKDAPPMAAATHPSPALTDVVPLRPRRFTIERMAWAASVVLALGVGYLANEVRKGQLVIDQQRAMLEERTASPAAEVASRVDSQPSAPATTTAAAPTRSGRPRLTKPDSMRGPKPPGPAEAADLALRGANQQLGSAALGAGTPDAARERADARSAASSTGGAGGRTTPRLSQPATPTPRRDQPALARRAEPRQSPEAGLAAAPAAAAPVAAHDSAADEAEGAAARLPTAFRRISLEQAVILLSGSIRLIDGMVPSRVEEGPGTLVPGSDPGRSVIRVVYADPRGRRLTLDQQPGPSGLGADATSVNGLMRGDTLMTSAGAGGMRIRWVDRKSFWLSLTGTLPTDSMRALVARIR